LKQLLNEQSFPAVDIHGALPQPERLARFTVLYFFVFFFFFF
jgi:hypothetical protein